MWQQWKKDAWTAGTAHLRDGRTEAWTPDEVRAGVGRVKEMLAGGLRIPAAWVHDENNRPRSAAQMAADIAARNMHTFAEVKDARFDEASGGMDVLLEGQDEDDYKQLFKTKFTSPQIDRDWTDGEKRHWPGLSVAHVAVVSNPIQFRQPPFQMAADGKAAPIWLAAEDYIEGGPMAKEKGKEPDTEGATDGLSAVIEALRATGMVIPDEVATANDLVIAIKASKGEPDVDTEPSPTGTSGEAAAPPVMMSADAAGKMQAENVKLKADLEKAQGQMLKRDRDQMATRIAACYASGRAAPTHRDAWTKQLNGAVQLSADVAKGSIPVQLAADVAAHEKLPAGSIWSGERQTAPTGGFEAPQPTDATENGDKEEVRKEASERAKQYSVSQAK